MKKILISLAFVCSSCMTSKPYSGHKLKKISEDLLYFKQMVQEDYNDDKIDYNTASTYFNLLETFSYDIKKEYKKAREAANQIR